MATSSICSTFSTLLISNSNTTSTKSIPTISSWKRRSLLLPTTKIHFQSKSPSPTIALSTPTPRASSYQGFAEEDDEGEEEIPEDEDDSDEEEDEEDEDAREKMAYLQEEETEKEEQRPRRQPISEIDASSYEGILSPDEIQIAAEYEALYGPGWTGISVLGNDVDKAEKEMDAEMTKPVERDDLEEAVVQVRRVTKVRQGGRTISFRAVVIVGNKKGKVGVGVGNALEVIPAVQKASKDAKRHVVDVPMSRSNSFPHRAEGRYGAAKVMLKPAAAGSGVSAGGSVRVMLEMVGIQNGLGKQLGSDNALNNARAVVDAFSKMRHFHEVAEMRGIPKEELWK